MRNLLQRAIAIAVLTTASISAQNCPDTYAKWFEGDALVGPVLTCGGFDISVEGLRVQVPGGRCPSFITVTPPHFSCVYQRGCNTMCKPNGSVFIQTLRYKCTMEWALIIPLGRYCHPAGHTNVGQLTTYRTVSCNGGGGGGGGGGNGDAGGDS